MKIIYTIFSLVILLSPVNSAFAQSETNASSFMAGQNITFDTAEKMKKRAAEPVQAKAGLMPILDDVEKQEVTVLEDDYSGEYLRATFENLSKLYWKMDALELSDDKAIDNFLLINECDLYDQFYSDDFEWLRVRKAARQMIDNNKDSFSKKYKIILPVDLGRYDMERKGFPLVNGTSFLDLRRIEIGGNSTNTKVCGEDDDIENYPRNVILVLSKPFQFDFLELDEHIAQAYIIRQRYEPAERPKDLRGGDFNRLAFARIRITFDKYQGDTKDSGGDQVGIMFGRLDGIDIFEDPFEKRLLSSIDLD